MRDRIWSRWETIVVIGIFIILNIFFASFSLWVYFTSQQLCHDMGMQLYHRPFTWIECFTYGGGTSIMPGMLFFIVGLLLVGWDHYRYETEQELKKIVKEIEEKI